MHQIEEEWHFDGEIKTDRKLLRGNAQKQAQQRCRWQGLHQNHPDPKTTTLLLIIRQKVVPDSMIYTNCWRVYNALNVSDFKHYRINHCCFQTGIII